MPKYTNEKIIEILRNLSDRLGRKNISSKDIASVMSISTLKYRFGSIGNALQEANLQRTDSRENFKGRGRSISDEDLFTALYEIEIQVKREPGYNDCNAKGKYSVRPYRQRFGKWPDVLAHYRRWKTENSEIVSGIRAHDPTHEVTRQTPNRVFHLSEKTSTRKAPQQLYGEPIEFRGLRHAPINEQGVVFLFAMVSRELGFNIESVQQGFPDCEGKYLHDTKRNLWAKARIEFEYRASNFRDHSHDSKKCDFIVCWTNDWPDCPVQVIELRTEILKLPSR